MREVLIAFGVAFVFGVIWLLADLFFDGGSDDDLG